MRRAPADGSPLAMALLEDALASPLGDASLLRDELVDNGDACLMELHELVRGVLGMPPSSRLYHFAN